MDKLVSAGVKNKYWIHSRDFSKGVFNLAFNNVSGPFLERNLNLFGQLKEFIALNHGDLRPNIRLNILLELVQSLEHVITSLMNERTLINILPLCRLFMDNILRYYYFDEHPVDDIDIYSFDRKKYPQFNKSKYMYKIFSKELHQDYHYSGAENHYGSIMNRNLDPSHTRDRSQYILNIMKTMMVSTLDIMADISVKHAKATYKQNLCIFEFITLIYVSASEQIIQLEYQNA